MLVVARALGGGTAIGQVDRGAVGMESRRLGRAVPLGGVALGDGNAARLQALDIVVAMAVWSPGSKL